MGLYRYEAFSTTRYLGLIGTLIAVYHDVYITPIGYQFLPKYKMTFQFQCLKIPLQDFKCNCSLSGGPGNYYAFTLSRYQRH